MTHRFELVPFAAAGAATFTCCRCSGRYNQAHGPVWADLNGPAFAAYYCDACKNITETDQRLDEEGFRC